MKKNLTIVALAAIAVFGLAACNNNQQPAVENTDTTVVVEEAPATPAVEEVAVADEPVKEAVAETKDNKVVKAAKKGAQEVKEAAETTEKVVETAKDAAKTVEVTTSKIQSEAASIEQKQKTKKKAPLGAGTNTL